MSLLPHRAPKLCPTCQHPAPGLVGRLVEPLIWANDCCHRSVDDPWSYLGDDECGCRDESHARLHVPGTRRAHASRVDAY
ncbi:hypothetical protein [Nocardioides sp. W7]|uniref:hypothetical protein n=1 Tax=Nocardioides sp. W7 TaxID=2931390 RepID=UPI001FD0D46F|nr:hypothetical protein [Nocardioides sp. W7]